MDIHNGWHIVGGCAGLGLCQCVIITQRRSYLGTTTGWPLATRTGRATCAGRVRQMLLAKASPRWLCAWPTTCFCCNILRG